MTKQAKDISTFIESIENGGRREDARTLITLIEDASGEKPELHGNIIGFGHYHYVYDTGTEGDSFLVGFSPRKANMVVYIMPGFTAYAPLLDKLGKFKTGKSCLYLGRLNNIDLKVLTKLVARSVKDMRKKYD